MLCRPKRVRTFMIIILTLPMAVTLIRKVTVLIIVMKTIVHGIRDATDGAHGGCKRDKSRGERICQ